MAETNKMLIDATHPEETRVVVLRGGRVEEFDYESAARKQLRGNIYLAKVTRVEPSLQAAFVDYGGNRHGFLAFNEIHPDYYQIPIADRQALLEEEAAAEAAEEAAAEARAEARARREAARAAAKAARKQARQGSEGEHDEEDDDEDDDIDHGDDDEAEVTDVHAEAVDRHEGGDSDGVGDNDNPDIGELPRPTSGVELLDAEAQTPRRLAEDRGLAHEERLSTEVGGEIVESRGADGGEPEAEASDAMTDAALARGSAPNGNGGTEVSEADLDRDSPEPHGLVEDQGVREVARSVAEAASSDAEESVEQVGSEDAMEELPSRPRRRPRSYKIQEVMKRRQVVLIQVVKEERGNKGAALTTYLSLAGRYTVLMPNTARGGGISRKITQPQDRKRLKAIAAELDVPEGMGLIIRTAGAARTKQEIKRDFEYLLRLWESVRELTLQSTAPSLVYEEGNLIKRSIRDLYNKDVEEVIVAGDDAHRDAKDFMRMLMPSHAKNVIHFKQPEPLFTRFQIERQLNAMFSPYVTLKSGGYLVINQTEALVAIDVNSGKATREFSIEETALVTNCEAAEEIARQLKLRDLAGLIVIDFIDMEEKRNNRTVERRLKEALKHDRARIQVGRISHFGLLEMSRQRLRTGVLEGSTSQCPHCQGTGIIRSVESVALAVLRGLEDAVMAGTHASLTAVTTPTVALYILNKKRSFINDMETRHGMPILVEGSDKMQGANFAIEKGPAPAQHHRRPEKAAVNMDWGFEDEDTEIQDEAEEINAEAETGDERSTRGERSERGEGDNRRRRRRRRRGRRGEREDRDDRHDRETRAGDEDEDRDDDTADSGEDGADDEFGDESAEEARAEREPGQPQESSEGSGAQRRRRRRGRRGGRRNRERLEQSTQAGSPDSSEDVDGETDDAIDEVTSGDDVSTNAPAIDAQAGDNRFSEPSSSDTAEPVTETISGHTEPEANRRAAQASPAAPSQAVEIETERSDAAPQPAIEMAAVEPDAAASQDGAATTSDASSSAETPRTPRGELAAAAPKIERVVVSPGAATSSNENLSDTPEAPVRKGWWQRRFGN
ncbi:MAG: Rne/Rng family ribonuclease [Hyphomicrobiaceae bacterium]